MLLFNVTTSALTSNVHNTKPNCCVRDGIKKFPFIKSFQVISPPPIYKFLSKVLTFVLYYSDLGSKCDRSFPSHNELMQWRVSLYCNARIHKWELKAVDVELFTYR